VDLTALNGSRSSKGSTDRLRQGLCAVDDEEPRHRWIDAARDPARYAHDLYANLRALDAMQATAIMIEAVPDDPAWQAVRDRLTRATTGDDDDRD